MTGSFVTARAYSVWGFVSGAGKGPVAPGSGEWGVVPCGPRRSDGSHRHEPLPTPHAFSSQHPIHEGAEEHDDTHNPIGGKKRPVEACQIARLHPPAFPAHPRRAALH